ncbi:proteophosphoglycan ppg4 [Moniliophthora roreri MCA 2997]|uniref:Proteophosphoglycan ppg4 n=2 Tax=Moniliophthora roreri TaxID=221103 RepID=V2WQ97_MONRO|nr:proteophosphoglycan ppg4 [Moniliophthora roreri MCA 2997]KAI3618192.1 proteophosphoglycan ppg4 [Moniliophthora roreri]
MANEESTSILESALSESFSPPPLKRQSLLAQTQPEVSTGSTTQGSDAPGQQNSSDSQSVDAEAWKSQYEEQVREWRAQNAEAREKAERERARWEAVREREKAEGISRPTYEEPGWQTVSGHKSLATSTVSVSELSSPSPADARDLVSGEVPKYSEPSTSHLDDPPHSRQDTGDDSQKWEDLPSDVTSSFPSMSFPGSNEGHSSPEHKPSSHSHPAPVAPTIAVFDSSLSTGTRVKALFASLAINLLLPFVNGVMLGFGEIFAKNVVLGWFGWKTPATSVGLSSLRRR